MGNEPWREYLGKLGIKYQAPYNGALGSLAAGLDVVTSTQVLLHIPPPILAGCFAIIAWCIAAAMVLWLVVGTFDYLLYDLMGRRIVTRF